MLPFNRSVKDVVSRLLQPVTVVVPAFNEEAGIGPQVLSIGRALEAAGMTGEIIVVDDGSSDRTAEEALQAGARVLRHLSNRGYGASIKSAILAAKHEIIVIIDADGTYPADQIPNLVAQLEDADMAVGARSGKQVHIPWVRRPAKWVLGWVAERIAGRKIPDLNSGLRTFRKSCAVQYFPILSDRFSFTTTITLAYLADDYRVVYRPIDYHKRVGKSKIVARHFMDFLALVLRSAMLFQPLRVFAPLSIFAGSLGLLKVIFDIVSIYPRTHRLGWSILFEPVLSTSAILLLLVALQLLLIGMVADGVIRRIARHSARLIPSQAIVEVEPVSQELAVRQ
ncbi:MAG: glycosyltransferase family 2 protein [Acidobacteriota bacterium]